MLWVSIIPPSLLSFCHLHLSILLTPLHSPPLCFPLVDVIIHTFSFLLHPQSLELCNAFGIVLVKRGTSSDSVCVCVCGRTHPCLLCDMIQQLNFFAFFNNIYILSLKYRTCGKNITVAY